MVSGRAKKRTVQRSRRMKDIITRTSLYCDEDKKPCQEASLEEETLTYRGEEEDGEIVCDFKEKEKRWIMELKTLEELAAFIKKYGNVVIKKNIDKEPVLSIEIYDGYRE